MSEGHTLTISSAEMEYLEGLLRANIKNLVPLSSTYYLAYDLDSDALGEALLSRVVNAKNAADPGPPILDNPGLPNSGPLVYSPEGSMESF